MCSESQDRGGSSSTRPRPHVDLDPAEICGVAGDWVYQREECDTVGSRIWREEAELTVKAIAPNGTPPTARALHAAHISKETRAWLASRPPSRFELTFTPKHGSWLNLIQGFSLSSPARSCVIFEWAR